MRPSAHNYMKQIPTGWRAGAIRAEQSATLSTYAAYPAEGAAAPSAECTDGILIAGAMRKPLPPRQSAADTCDSPAACSPTTSLAR